MKQRIDLRWLSDMRTPRPVTFGIPWEQGAHMPGDLLALSDGQKEIPASSWSTAYWPDGSVKWTAHAAVLDGSVRHFVLTDDVSAQCGGGLQAQDDGESITIETEQLRCRVAKAGGLFITSLVRKPQIATPMTGRLLCRIRTHDGWDETCPAQVTGAEIEQLSANRCCIKINGAHRQADGREPFLFTLRLYAYSGSDEIRLVHSLICNIDDDRMLSGLAVEFTVPMQGEAHNRHVAFSGEEGLYLEGVRGLLSNRGKRGERDGKAQNWYAQQLKPAYVELVPFDDESKWLAENIHEAAMWQNYRLSQLAASAWSLTKQTQPAASRVHIVSGQRAGGMLYVGSPAMQAVFSIRDFWQKYPMALEANGLAQDVAKARLWLWSDEASPMRFSFYDDRAHSPELTYEGSAAMGNDPVGIASTNEITIKLYEQIPSRQQLWDFSRDAQKTALLIATPDYYHNSAACGLWSVRAKGGGAMERLERLVSEMEGFYLRQRDQRDWYGFWNFGDVMHSYDACRHTWKYDFGGCAWQNTELVPNLWLWNSFLRTGDETIFEMARAMTRHTSEVDCYHMGELTGLGSRHNVVHWGCSCKEPRIMMAFLHRVFYFLTADERVGEVMELAANADLATVRNMPLLPPSYGKNTEVPKLRSGPDWTAFASNWLVHEERFADGRYIQKLLRGIRDLGADEIGLLAGTFFHYDPHTGQMEYIGVGNYSYHMVMIFGGAEVFFELMQRFPKEERLAQMLAEFGKAYAMDDTEIDAWSKGRVPDHRNFGSSMYGMKMMAWAAHYYKDKALGQKTWDVIKDCARQISKPNLSGLAVEEIDPLYAPVRTEECAVLSTNLAAQYALALFEALELIPEYLPNENE